MELPPLVQRVIADVSGYVGPIKQATGVLEGFGRGTTQGIDNATGKLQEMTAAAVEMAQALRSINIGGLSGLRNTVAEIDKLTTVFKNPAMTKSFIKRLSGYSQLTPDDFQRELADILSKKREQDGRLQKLIASEERKNQERIGEILVTESRAGDARLRQRVQTGIGGTVRGGFGGGIPVPGAPFPANLSRAGLDVLGSFISPEERAARMAARQARINPNTAGRLGLTGLVDAAVQQSQEAFATASQFQSTQGALRLTRDDQDDRERRFQRERAWRRQNLGPGLSAVPPGILTDAYGNGPPGEGGGGGLFGSGGMFGGVARRVASGFFAWRGFEEMINGFKAAATHYFTSAIEAHKALAESGIQAFKAAAGGLITGIGHAVTGFVSGLGQSLEGLLSAGPIQTQIAALGQTISGLIGGVHDILAGAVSGAGHLASGVVQSATRMLTGGIQTGAGIGQGIGGALTTAGSLMAFSGVGAPVGVGMALGGSLLSAGSSAVGGFLAKQAEAAGSILAAAVETISGLVSQMLAAAAQGVTSLVGILGQLTASIMAAGIESEKLATTFGLLTGSKEKGRGLFGELQGLTIVSPYTMGSLTSAAETLLGMGISADNLVKTMERLGDAAVGDEGRLRRLAIIYGEISAEGRMTGWRIRQAASLGIGVADLAQTAGMSGFDFRQRLAAGGIPGDIFRQTINRLTGPGGRMFGEMEAARGTTGGRWNELTNTVGVAAAKMGEAFNKAAGLADLFGKMATAVAGVTGKLEEFARRIGEFAGPLIREMLDLGMAVGKTVKDMIGAFGNNPAQIVKAFVDALFEATMTVLEIGAELSQFVGGILKQLPTLLPNLISGAWMALHNALSSSFAEDLLGKKNALGLRGSVDDIFGLMLRGTTSSFRTNRMANGGGRLDEILWEPGQWPVLGAVPDAMMRAPNGARELRKRSAANRGGGLGGGGGLLGLGGNLLDAAIAAGGNLFPGQAGLFQGIGRVVRGGLGFGPIPQTAQEFEDAVMNRRAFAQHLVGQNNLADRLVGANIRGSTEAYETFARSWAAGQQGNDPASLLERANEILEQNGRDAREFFEWAKTLRDTDRARFKELFPGVVE